MSTTIALTIALTIAPRRCYESYFVSSIIIAAVIEVISIYVLTSLAIFSWKTRNRKNVSKINDLSLISSLFTFLLCTSVLFTHLPGYPYPIMLWVNATFYWIGISLTYTILWKRQRKFYSDELLAYKVGKCHKILSSVAILGIYSFLAALVFTFQSQLDFKLCGTLRNSNLILPILTTFMVTVFAFQMLLFYLLINPLRSEEGVKVSDILCFRLKKDVHNMVVRLAICASICILTSILICVLMLLISTNRLETGWGNLVSLDLNVNTISVVCSFKSWKKRLFPFCKTTSDAECNHNSLTFSAV
ncbi:unnamed protein product [Clavelina lepadiformis]|uniref:Taste receptor type 2 n=1 Tax=Clavelina lepadiformis TaxID=159417 RepID=A0ABP0GMF7_CLALP